jgi:hypothetical protein
VIKGFWDLLSSGIESDAIAHIKAEAEFRPPPHKSITDDSHISRSGNILGNAPGHISVRNEDVGPD